MVLLEAGMEETIADTIEENISHWKQAGVGPLVLRIAGIVLITLVVVQLYRILWRWYWKKKEIKIQYRFLYNIIIILIYLIGFFALLMQFDKEGNLLRSILTGSGFVALGFSLAAQESLGNIINGIVLTVSKPFEVGDRIRLVNGNITGYVEDITLRHTIMRTFVNSRIIIPNSTINKDMIENSNYQIALASAFLDMVITHDSDVDIAMEIMEEEVGNHPYFVDRRTDIEKKQKPKVNVYIRDVTLYGVNLRTSMWTTNVDDNFDACSDCRYTIKKRFEESGILMAQLPSRPNEYARAGAIPSESGNYPPNHPNIAQPKPPKPEEGVSYTFKP